MNRILIIKLTAGTIALLLLISCSSSKKVKLDTADKKETAKVIETPPPKKEEPKPVPIEEKTKLISLADINFDFDRYDLRSDALALLAEHAKELKQSPNVKVVIEGHCDEWGSVEYNLALGERRASAVKSYLVKSGISADRISTISYGKEKPLDSRRTQAAWAKNRRAAFVIKG